MTPADVSKACVCILQGDSLSQTLQTYSCGMCAWQLKALIPNVLGQTFCLEYNRLTAEACCKHVVQTAQSEVDSNPRASRAMRDFANIREADAEVGVRKTLVKHGLTCPVQISSVDLGEKKDMTNFPWIKPSNWFGFLLQTGALPRQLVGVPTMSKMKAVLSKFWERYRSMDSQHPVFDLERAGTVCLESLIPYYSHSDEGRTFRDAPLWVLNIHGVIGRGTVAYLKANKHLEPCDENAQGLNYTGQTWANHFLLCTMMKHVATHDALSRMLGAFAEDAQAMLHEGITNGETKVQFVHLAMKGDLPALVKVARFLRTFQHAPKAASTKKPCQGICWKCLAGQERDDAHDRLPYPYEDVSMQPVWESTIGTKAPWVQAPSILDGLNLDLKRSIDFFQSDFFHNVHLGVLKSFTSSALVSLVEARPVLPCFANLTSVEKRFDRLTEMYQDYFQQRGRKPFVSELSRDMCCWPMASQCPAAKWNKGQASVEILRFIDWFAGQHLSGSTDPIMRSIVLG